MKNYNNKNIAMNTNRRHFGMILLLGSLLAVVLLATPAAAQTAFKGQLHISDEQISQQGSLLRVRMHVSYDDNLLNRGETLDFTPVLKSGFHHQALSSVVITGKGADQNRLRANIPVVLRDQNHKGKRGFEYDTTIPYEEWMEGASLYIESDERNRKGKSHIYEDLIFENLRIGRSPASTDDPIEMVAGISGNNYQTDSYMVKDYALGNTGTSTMGNRITTRRTPTFAGPQAQPEWIQMIEPVQPKDGGLTVKGTIALADKRRIGAMSTSKFNEAIFRELRKALGDQLAIAGTTINTLSITGYGAPIGNYRQNETRCSARAMELKRYLLTRGGEAPNSINVSWVAEDWDSIRAIVAGSTMRLRDAALDIIRSVDVSSGRENQLRMLGGGSVYSQLWNTVFPQVCRIEYTATLRREPAGSSLSAERTVSLHSMYVTASNFKKGSREFNDIIDLSARLYPNHVEACINAAGIALMRGDLPTAAMYLKGLETDARAYNNLGVLYLLQGDSSKAEVYLMMAKAAGVPEAARVLRTLNL